MHFTKRYGRKLFKAGVMVHQQDIAKRLREVKQVLLCVMCPAAHGKKFSIVP
jgi:hypothetical protein